MSSINFPPTKTTNVTKINRVEGLVGTRSVNDYEEKFILSCVAKNKKRGALSDVPLSTAQQSFLDTIYNRHFA